MELTFITPTLNAATTLPATLESIRREASGIDYEHLVIDGLSTDGTAEMVGEIAGREDSGRLRLLSAKDGGAYDAMNRGIHEAGGSVVAILNADDHYIEGALDPVRRIFREDPKVGVVAGSILLRYPDGRDERRDPEPGRRGRLGIVPPIWHPATFVRRSVYEKVGVYNTEYTIAADIDWAFRAIDKGVRFERVDQPLTRMLTGGLSTRAYHFTAMEMLRIRRRRRGIVGRLSHILYYKNSRLRKCRATPQPRWSYWGWVLRDLITGGKGEA